VANFAAFVASDRASAMTGASTNLTCGSLVDQKLCEKGQTRASLLSIRRLTTAWFIAWLVSHNRS
jgi:hypothetical protein